MGTRKRCDYTFSIGERRGETCGRIVFTDGRTKCCYHTPEYIERKKAYNIERRKTNPDERRKTNTDERDGEQETTPLPPQEIPQKTTHHREDRENQSAINHLTNLRELMEVTKRNNDLLLLLTMAIAGMNRNNKKESNV